MSWKLGEQLSMREDGRKALPGRGQVAFHRHMASVITVTSVDSDLVDNEKLKWPQAEEIKH